MSSRGRLCPLFGFLVVDESSFFRVCDCYYTYWLTFTLVQAKIASVFLMSFARGFFNRLKDYEAVKAGLTLPWSQGPVEGHVHRLKLLKRQAYGQASFETLRKRVLRCG